jgi:glycosyltransferase involved in cell wall biosynthesis
MRVALVGDEYYPDISGVPRYAFELSHHLARLGIEPVVITHAHPGQPEEEEISGVRIRRIPGLVLNSPHRAASPFLFRRCHAYIREGKYDVVHGLDIYSSMADMAVLFARKHHIPSVLTCHSINESDFSVFLQRPVLFPIRKANAVIAVSRASERFCRFLGVASQRIAVIPNGVDLSSFNQKQDGTLMRRKLGLDEQPVVMTALRLIRRKEPARLVAVFPKILEVIPDAKLVIAGSGPEEAKLTRQIKRLDITDSVFLVGGLQKEEIALLMAAADVFVLPSRAEAFGLSVLEAAAVGLPVVCSHAGGIPEVFRDNLDAVLCPPGDDCAIARAIICLIQDREFANRLRRNALGTASRFTWEIAAQRTLRVYEKVCQENTKDCSHH